MKKLIPFLLFIIFLVAGCSNMLLDLQDLELESGENIRLSGTDGADITGIAIDTNDDGRPDGIDINGDGNIDFAFVIADSTPSLGVYAADTNGDGIANIYIRVSSSGTSTINTGTEGSGPAVTVAVNDDGVTVFSGADIPTGTTPNAGTPAVAATTDINGDGNIDAADTALLAKLTFTVTGDTVSITDADSDISGILNIPATYDGKPVNAIGNEAFKDCSNLTSVSMPSSITAIGGSAFSGCSALSAITIPDAVTVISGAMFTDCTSLSSITIPASVTFIEETAFSGCTSLTSLIMLPTTAPTAAADILAGTSTAASLTYPDGAAGYDEDETVWVNTSVLIKDGDVDGDGVVDGDDTTLLADLTFTPDGEEYILSDVDTSISGTIIIPATYLGKPVTSIAANAFENCTSLTAIAVPAGVVSIGDNAFTNCTTLSSLTMLPTTAPTTGADAFTGITDAVSLNYPSDAIGYEIDGTPWVDTTIFHKTNDLNGDGLVDDSDSSLSSSLTFTITGDEATLTGAATSISGKLIIPSTYNGKPVTKIGSDAFKDCTSLTSVTIPAGIAAIEDSAFQGCRALGNITMLPESAPITVSNAFEDISMSISLSYPVGATGYDTPDTVWVDSSVLLKEGDINGDGVVNAVDNNILFTKIDFDDSGAEAILTRVTDTTLSGTLNIPAIFNEKPVTIIGPMAFMNCSELTSITIPEGVVSIENHVFFYCTGLKTLTMTPTTAPATALTPFLGITKEINIQYPVGATGYDVSPWEEANVGDINGDYEVTPADIEKFNKLTFTETATEVTLIDCSTSITDKLRLPSTVNGKPLTAIGDSTFENCTALNSVRIPEGVTTIGNKVFKNCPSLKAFTLNSPTAPSISAETFDGIAEAYLSIPSDAITYDATPWNDVAVFYREGDLNGDGVINSVDEDILAELTFTTTGAPDTNTILLQQVGFSITGKLVIPSSYNGREVTIFSPSALLNRSNLTSVVVPNTVTEVGNWCFKGCTSLTSVNIPSELSTFGQSMFEDCTALTTIDIPETVETIGYAAFSGCTALTNINIASGVTNIGPNAFSECSTLISITIPDSITSLGDRAFYSCSLLETVTLPTELITIGDNAFSNCKALKTINIPNKVTSIGASAFSQCWELAPLTFAPDSSLTTIGNNAFEYCKKLTSVNIPDSVTSMGVRAFHNCVELTSVTLPAGITTISDEAFYYCKKLSSIVIPENVTSIGSNSFKYCLVLTSVTLSANLTTLGGGAFSKCYELKALDIPVGVTSFPIYCFQSCEKLETFTLHTTMPPTLTGDPFGGTVAEVLRIPSGAEGNYVGAPWTTTTIFSTVETF